MLRPTYRRSHRASHGLQQSHRIHPRYVRYPRSRYSYPPRMVRHPNFYPQPAPAAQPGFFESIISLIAAFLCLKRSQPRRRPRLVGGSSDIHTSGPNITSGGGSCGGGGGGSCGGGTSGSGGSCGGGGGTSGGGSGSGGGGGTSGGGGGSCGGGGGSCGGGGGSCGGGGGSCGGGGGGGD